MNQLASVVIVMALITLHCVDCHDESANETDQLTNDKQFNRPLVDQRNAFTPKDRFNSDKIIFDRGDLYSYGTTIPPNERPGNRPISADRRKSNDTDQQYFSKANGEYQFSLKVSKGVRHIESGEFEERNGQQIFIIRGFFEHVENDGTLKITAYIFDHTGYHLIPVQTDIDPTAVVDFRPTDGECDLAKGEYCIDRKLLNLMVG